MCLQIPVISDFLEAMHIQKEDFKIVISYNDSVTTNPYVCIADVTGVIDITVVDQIFRTSLPNEYDGWVLAVDDDDIAEN